MTIRAKIGVMIRLEVNIGRPMLVLILGGCPCVGLGTLQAKSYITDTATILASGSS